MLTTIEDRFAIGELMTGWIHRDLGEWDLLRDLFTEDGVIEISWFSGSASDFVSESARMGASRIATKHLIATPAVRFSDDGLRAMSETNAMVVAENREARLGSQTHTRFIDRLEKVEGRWRIADRRAVYDFASFTFPDGFVEIDRAVAETYPAEYAALAYVLGAGGFPVEGTYPTRGSVEEREIKDAAGAWLEAGRA